MAVTKRLAVNVLMNWAAMAVNMVVPFFLTPFVVRHLGPAGYGVWILAVSTVSYLNLLDLGLRSAVVRFVSKAQAKGELDEATRVIQAALWFRVVLAAGVGVFSTALAALMPHFFHIPFELIRAAQITTLLCALGIAVTLITGVFGGVLQATHRFDLLSYITMGQTLTRAAGVLLILRSGHGLVPLAGWELGVITLFGVVTTLSANRVFPHSRARLRRPELTVLRTISSYSFTTFIYIIAVQIIGNTDNLVVGAFLSVSAVTFYAIGGSLLNYAYQVSSALSGTFTPMASNLEASGRFEDLRTMLIRGTQATLALALPINVGLVFRGGTFIRLWMGPQYETIAETVVRILMISMYFGVANGTAASIMMAIERHRPVAKNALFEAFFNLGLSILLLKTVGIYGVAWGTSVSIVVTHLAFWPGYVKKVLGVAPATYMWQGWGKITLCVLPFAFVLAVTDRYWRATNLAIFFVQILVVLPVYVACVAFVFRKEAAELIARWQASRRRPVLQAS